MRDLLFVQPRLTGTGQLLLLARDSAGVTETFARVFEGLSLVRADCKDGCLFVPPRGTFFVLFALIRVRRPCWRSSQSVGSPGEDAAAASDRRHGGRRRVPSAHWDYLRRAVPSRFPLPVAVACVGESGVKTEEGARGEGLRDAAAS